MGKYSVLTDPAADAVVEAELDIVVAEIVRYFGEHLCAVLLVGGFGRGEGTIVQDTEGYRPINDYDMIIVVPNRKKLPAQLLEALPEFGEQLNRKVMVKQVDLAILDARFLALPTPSVGRYEIKHGHMIVYGRLPYKIRSFPAHWLPLFEGTRYYRNRAGGLLIARLLLDGKGVFDDDQRGELAWLEISKAILTLGDGYLISAHLYHYSYAERKRRLLSLSIPETIRELYTKGIDYKLSPPDWSWDLEALEKRWTQIVAMYLQVFLEFESKRYGRPFADLRDYGNTVMAQGNSGWRFLARLRGLWNREDRPEVMQERVVMMHLLKARLEEGANDLDFAQHWLGAAPSPGSFLEQWVALAEPILRDWHPEGIITRLIKNPLRDSAAGC